MVLVVMETGGKIYYGRIKGGVVSGTLKEYRFFFIKFKLQFIVTLISKKMSRYNQVAGHFIVFTAIY
jgi:hypothetical protein